MVLERDYVLESLAALGPGGPHMILALGRSRRAGGGGGGRTVGSHCGITYGSPAKMVQNGGPPKVTGLPGNQLDYSSFWWITEGNFAD